MIASVRLVTLSLLTMFVPSAASAIQPTVAERAGLITLAPGVHLYQPATPPRCGEGRPLLLLLHGTGGSGRAMIDAVRNAADRHGVALLALDAVGENWDAVDSFFDDYERGSAAGRTIWPRPQFGADAPRVRAALDRVLADPAIDRRRIGLLGFSHGASYALSVGAANPGRFGTILAFSPGILVLPEDITPGQRVFVAHGRRDAVQPFQRTSGQFVARLNALAFAVTFRPFSGGHELPPVVLHEGIRFFVEGAGCGV